MHRQSDAHARFRARRSEKWAVGRGTVGPWPTTRWPRSVRLIENGVPDCVASRVSRRIRHIPLAVDVDGQIAAALFLRRGQGQVWYENHVLVQRHGSWWVVGGGGATGGEDAARDAPGHGDL